MCFFLKVLNIQKKTDIVYEGLSLLSPVLPYSIFHVILTSWESAVLFYLFCFFFVYEWFMQHDYWVWVLVSKVIWLRTGWMMWLFKPSLSRPSLKWAPVEFWGENTRSVGWFAPNHALDSRPKALNPGIGICPNHGQYAKSFFLVQGAN